MSKLKQRIEEVKKEYAEAPPEGKRKTVLFYACVLCFSVEIILGIIFFLFPDRLPIYLVLFFLFLFILLRCGAILYNRVSGKTEKTDHDGEDSD